MDKELLAIRNLALQVALEYHKVTGTPFTVDELVASSNKFYSFLNPTTAKANLALVK